MNTKDEEITCLKNRINELEKQLDNLRLSRRVLMDLLEQVEKEKNILCSRTRFLAKTDKIFGKNYITSQKYFQGFTLLYQPPHNEAIHAKERGY